MKWSTSIIALLSIVDALRIHRTDTEDSNSKRNWLRRHLQESQPSHENSPESHRVHSLPLGDHLPFDLYSGHLNASKDGDKKFFYWLVAPESEKESLDTPLVIWLNGGPGCSSSDGFFLENGPLMFEQMPSNEWKLTLNPYSWHLAPAWVLYVDQPVGTGLSFTKSQQYPTNDEEVNVDFQYFLEEFLQFYGDFFLKEDQKMTKRPVFFSGESHAGHYIPSIMDYILSKESESRIQITIGGAAIGNGWIDPFNQYAAADLAYAMGLVNMSQKAHLDKQEKECQRAIASAVYDSKVCFALLDSIVDQSHGATSVTQVSMYDATKIERKGSVREFPKNHDVIESYLGHRSPPPGYFPVNSVDVLHAIHATEAIEQNQFYQECSDPPYYALKHQDALGVVPQVTRLLEGKIRLLFYNGMNDLICNHIGTEKSLMNLVWSQGDAWIMTPRFTWTIRTDSTPAAFVHEYQNLIFLKIPDAGHMVPLDQPEVSLRMMQVFLRGGTFQENQQYLERTTQTMTSC
jgi:carboxypeptidase D